MFLSRNDKLPGISRLNFSDLDQYNLILKWTLVITSPKNSKKRFFYVLTTRRSALRARCRGFGQFILRNIQRTHVLKYIKTWKNCTKMKIWSVMLFRLFDVRFILP